MKKLLVIVACQVLAGCAAVAIPADVPAIPKPPTTVQALFQNANAKATLYDGYGDGLQRDALWFDLPLLGAAAAAAGVLFYAKPPAQANEVFGIGLGAGTLTALRTRIDPNSAADAYHLAARQLRCVVDNGEPFTHLVVIAKDETASEAAIVNQLRSARDRLSTDLGKASVTPENPNDPNVVAALQALSTAVKNGNANLALAEGELAAIQNAATLVASTIGDIEGTLRTALHHDSIDFASLRQQLSTAAQNQANAIATKSTTQATPRATGPTLEQMNLMNAGAAKAAAQEAAEITAKVNQLQDDAKAVSGLVDQTKAVATNNDVIGCKASK